MSLEGGARRRGAISLNINYRKKRSVTDHNRRIVNKEELPITGPNRERCALHLLWETYCPATPPMRNCHHLGLILFSYGLSFRTTPLNVFLLLYKLMLLFLICGTCLWFCHICISPNVILCYSWIKSLLLVKCFIFKINRINNLRSDKIISLNKRKIWLSPETEQLWLNVWIPMGEKKNFLNTYIYLCECFQWIRWRSHMI